VNSKQIDKLIEEAWQIEQHDAREAGRLGFMARSLAIATMPHRKTEKSEFVRRNGAFILSMWSRPRIGLPYGSVPRLLTAWMTTEAVRTKERELVLGRTLSGFMNQLGMTATGGRWGSIPRLRDQMRRLLTCSIQGTWKSDTRDVGTNVQVASKWNLWWDPQSPEQAGLWQSSITLNQDFFDEVVHHPVPVDLGVLKTLKKSPLALDIYIWLTYRVNYLRGRAEIPWPAIQMQFGAGYPLTPQGQRDFRKAFREQLKKVVIAYNPSPRVEESAQCLVLHPSRSHILPRRT
jgi:hypothetical protein